MSKLNKNQSKTDAENPVVQRKQLRTRYIFSGLMFLAFILTLFNPLGKDLSRDSLIFLGLAIIPWLSEFVASFKVSAGGVEVTLPQLQSVEAKANAAFEAAKNPRVPKPIPAARDDIRKSLTGKRTTREEEPAESTRRRGGVNSALAVDPDDPNKILFGHNPRNNDRKLSVKIEKIPGESFYRRVNMRVESTNPQKPLEGEVIFYLHPTFTSPKYSVDVENGVAEDTIVSYGVFTIGAVADNGETRLGFNLYELNDHRDAFFNR